MIRLRFTGFLLCALLALECPSTARAQCVGDCNGDGEVTVDEIIVGVTIALGSEPVSQCLAFDADGNGRVTIDEILQAVSALLTACKPVIDGACLAPGATGLIPCEPGLPVRVFRCDNLLGCLHSASDRTLLGESVMDDQGHFSVQFQAAAMGLPLIFEATLDDAGTTVRLIDFGAAGGAAGLGGPRRTAAGGGAAAGIVIDPSSEGAVRALDAAGLDNVVDRTADDLTDGVRRESALGQVYAGLNNQEAITVGADIAADVLFVEPQRMVISPDDTELYVTSEPDRSIARLTRDPSTGSLRVAQILGSAGAAGPLGLERPAYVALSPDGKNAYLTDNRVSDPGALFVFARDTATGDMTLHNTLAFGQKPLAALFRPSSLAVTADGSRVFVASTSSDSASAVSVFDRAAAGDLNLLSTTSSGTIVPNLIFLTLAPSGGQQVYVVNSSVASELLVLARAGSDRLSLIQTVRDLKEASGLAFSADGQNAYLVEDSGNLRTFTRNSLDGSLTSLGALDGVLRIITDVTVSPDGTNVYTASIEINRALGINETAVTTFQRSRNGDLLKSRTTQILGREVAAGSAESVTFLPGVPSVAISRDGRNVYVSSPPDNAIAVFDRLADSGELQMRELTRIPAESLPAPPPADECANATVIQTLPFVDSLDTAAASVSADDPVLSCGAGGQQGHSVWYRFTAPGTGIVAISTSGTIYNTVLAVQTGHCGALTELACNDDNFPQFAFSALRVPVRAGAQYFVEVTNFGARPGGVLHIRADFGPRLCNRCQSSADCQQGNCFRCSFNCAANAPDRCGIQGTFIDCEDGTF